MSVTPAELAEQLAEQLGPEHAATIADLQADMAAGLALYLQGQAGQALTVFGGPPATAHGQTTLLAVSAVMAAAALAVNAAVGDDDTRGWCALTALQERAADYRAAFQLLTNC